MGSHYRMRVITSGSRAATTRRLAARGLAAVLAGGVAVALLAAPAEASPRSAGVDVTVARVTHGARQVAPGDSVLLSATILNRGDTATSAAAPLVLTFPGLPAGVVVRPADPRQPGLSCAPGSCTYTTPVEPQKVTSLPLVASVSRTMAPGTPVTFGITADSATDSDDTYATSQVRFRVAARTAAAVRLDVRPVSDLTVGRPATLHARLINVAGTPARNLRVSHVVGTTLLDHVRVSGDGWRCTGVRVCRVAGPLPVGTSSTPLTISGTVSRTVHTQATAPAAAAAGRFGTAQWRSTVSRGGPQSHSLTVRTALPRQRTPQPAVQVPDWTQHAHLEAALTAVGDVRPGGRVRFEAEALHNGVSHTRGTTRLTVTLPPGLTSARVVDHAWSCTTHRHQRDLRCDLRRGISRAAPAPRVIVTARAARTIGRHLAAARMAVTWRSDDGAHRDRDSGPVTVLPPVGVRASTSDHSVMAPARGTAGVGRKSVMLHARISGTDERVRPAHRWQQIAGPRVHWLDPHQQQNGQTHATTRFAVPPVSRARTVAFRVSATAHAATATDTIRVHITPRHRAAFADRSRTPRLTKPHRIPDRSDWRGRRVGNPVAISIGRPGATRVRAGQRIQLQATVTGGSRHRWRVLAGPERTLPGPRDGTSVTVQAPPHPGLVMIGLRSTDARGRHSHRAEVIRVLPPRTPTSASVSAAAVSGFCSLFGDAASGTLPQGMKVADGQATFTPGRVSTSGGKCSSPGAQISFSQATLVLGEHTFTGITGSLDATGLSVTAGSFAVPASWSRALAYLGESTPTLAFRASSGSAITAPWAGSALGSLSGSFTVSDFLFLDLPGGWTGSTTFSFTPQAKSPLSLAASAADTSGTDKSGSVELNGAVASDGTFTLTAQVANVAIFPASDGSQATLNGSAKVALTDPDGSVSYDVTASLDGAIQLFPEFTLKSATLGWDDKGLSVAGTGLLTAGSDRVAMSLTGTYAGDSDWSLTITQQAPWQNPDVTVSGLTGKLTYAQQTLGFSVTGSASKVDLPDSLTVTSLTALVTNQCPSPAGGCTAGDLRLSLDAKGTISLAGQTDDYNGSIDVDLTTMAIDFSATVAGSFGPAGLPLTQVAVQAGDAVDVPGTCAPAKGADAGETTVFTAQVDDVFGDDNVAVIGEINDLGYCFSADLAQFSPTGKDTTDSAFDGVALIYSTYATTVSVPGQKTPVAIAAKTAGLYGTFTAPQSLSGTLGGFAGQGTFSAVVTDGSGGMGFTGTIDYTFDQPLYLLGSADQPQSDSLTLDDVALTVDYSAADFEIDLAGDGTYSADGTPMPLTVGVDVDLTEVSFGFSASAADGDPVTDAFGYPGLVIDNLAISGSIGLSDSLAFAATADLPSSWDGSLGVQPNTPISLAIDISATPCFQFSVGQAGQTVAAVDFMNDGVLVADYANIVLAPVGCQFADVTITPGFAFDFDGSVAGDQVDFNSDLTLGDSGFALTASVFVAQFDLGGSTTFDNNTLTLNLDPSSDVFEIGMAATVDVGGNTLAISGKYDHTGPGAVTADFSAQSQGQVDIAGFGLDNATVDLTYSSTPSTSALSFSLAGDISFLDQNIDGTLALTTANGSVVSASGNMQVSVDVGVASAQGPLTFAYQSGKGAAVSFGPGTISAFGVTFQQVTGSLQPDGSYAIQASIPIPLQNASAADAWLYGNDGGEFNTTFGGQLQINVTGGNGQAAAIGYQGSSVWVNSQWAEHTWDSYGSNVALPVGGCPAPSVSGDGAVGNPAVNFWLNPAAVENASTGDSDDGDYCLLFTSNIL